MFRQIRRLLCLFSILSLSPVSSAALITHNGYTLDESTNVVTGGGLEWLQWDETQGLSVLQALNQFNAAGWRLANNTEMAALLNNWDFGSSFTFDNDETTYQSTVRDNNGVDTIPGDSYREFLDLFSLTEFRDSFYSLSDPLERAWAWFGDRSIHDAFSTYNIALIGDDFTVRHTGRSFDAWAYMEKNRFGATSFSYAGVALVRSTSIPEPNSVSLLAFFIIALLSVFLRRQNYFHKINEYMA